MGATKSKNQLFEDSLKLFSEVEQAQIKELYKKICQENQESFNKGNLETYLQMQLDPRVAGHLFLYMTHVFDHQQLDQDGKQQVAGSCTEITYQQFLVTLAHLLKGSVLEKAHVLCCLATGTSPESASVQNLLELIVTVFYSYTMTMMRSDSAFSSWKLFATEASTLHFAKTLLHGLVYKDGKQMCDSKEELPLDQNYSVEDIERWLTNSSLLLSILHDVFHICFPVSFVEGASCLSASLCPKCEEVNWNKAMTLLDPPSVLYLNSHLPTELRSEWRLLFSSRCHGESFHTLVKHILDKGPCLVIIKDTQGHIFGGFASQSWALRPQFVGDSQCFLFGIRPHLEVYPASGYNDNYMYLNQGQETLPNGLGMGGQFGYYGFWLDYEYGKGQSKAEPKCTTFNSPQLSGQPHFNIDVLEVWGVGPTRDQEPDAAEGKLGSILDRDMEAKAMLTLLDKGPVSEGLREADPTADSPGDETLPPLS